MNLACRIFGHVPVETESHRIWCQTGCCSARCGATCVCARCFDQYMVPMDGFIVEILDEAPKITCRRKIAPRKGVFR